jgi:hypothetical protein
MNELETLTVKELQDKLVSLGMPQEDVEAFKTKAPLIASIKTMMAKDAVREPEEEVKKVATIEEPINPSEEKKVNKEWKSKAERMKAQLEAQEQVSILVPLADGERAGVVEWKVDKDGQRYQNHISGAVESVQLNGYKYLIAKGVYTRVPRQIAEVISKAQSQTLEAGKNISLDRTDPNTGRPMADSL